MSTAIRILSQVCITNNIILYNIPSFPATQYNSTSVVGWLLKHTKLCGREVDDMGATPLHLACELGHVTLVRAFVRRFVVFNVVLTLFEILNVTFLSVLADGFLWFCQVRYCG